MTDFEKADLCILEYDMDVQPILKDYLMMDWIFEDLKFTKHEA